MKKTALRAGALALFVAMAAGCATTGLDDVKATADRAAADAAAAISAAEAARAAADRAAQALDLADRVDQPRVLFRLLVGLRPLRLVRAGNALVHVVDDVQELLLGRAVEALRTCLREAGFSDVRVRSE